MENTITVETSFSDKEVRKTLTYYINHTHKSWIIFPIFALVFVILIYNSIVSKIDTYKLGLFVVLALTFFTLHWCFYLRPINSYIHFYNNRGCRSFTFSEDNIRIVSKDAESTISWDAFKKAYDIPLAFLFTDENKFLYIFPKRCFKSTSDIEELGKLIGSKMSIVIT